MALDIPRRRRFSIGFTVSLIPLLTSVRFGRFISLRSHRIHFLFGVLTFPAGVLFCAERRVFVPQQSLHRGFSTKHFGNIQTNISRQVGPDESLGCTSFRPANAEPWQFAIDANSPHG